MLTNKAKALGITTIAVIVVAGLGYGQYQNTKQIARLESQPVPTTEVRIVTPTGAPTATPSAVLKTTRIYTPATVTKGVK